MDNIDKIIGVHVHVFSVGTTGTHPAVILFSLFLSTYKFDNSILSENVKTNGGKPILSDAVDARIPLNGWTFICEIL